jgi:hypothetical protein
MFDLDYHNRPSLIGECDACSRPSKLFALPGRRARHCLECSADIATLFLLATEIDVSRRSRLDVEHLEREWAEVDQRLMSRHDANRHPDKW